MNASPRLEVSVCPALMSAIPSLAGQLPTRALCNRRRAFGGDCAHDRQPRCDGLFAGQAFAIVEATAAQQLEEGKFGKKGMVMFTLIVEALGSEHRDVYDATYGSVGPVNRTT